MKAFLILIGMSGAAVITVLCGLSYAFSLIVRAYALYRIFTGKLTIRGIRKEFDEGKLG